MAYGGGRRAMPRSKKGHTAHTRMGLPRGNPLAGGGNFKSGGARGVRSGSGRRRAGAGRRRY